MNRLKIGLLVFAIGLPVFFRGQDVGHPPVVDIQIREVSRLEKRLGFNFKGKLVLVELAGNGITHQRTVALAVYYPASGAPAYTVTRSLLRMSEMLREEFPDGIDPELAKKVLHFLVPSSWGYPDSSLATPMLVEVLQERIPNIPKEKLKYYIDNIFELTKIGITGNDWKMQVVIYGDDDAIHLDQFKGTLAPFSISQFKTTVLFERQGKGPHPRFPTEEDLKTALRNKKLLLEGGEFKQPNKNE